MSGPVKISYAGKDISEDELPPRDRARDGSITFDGTISSLFGRPFFMDTLAISKALNVRESFVANRLAIIRDAR